jgi:type II secretory pathway pseudopilin PulG
MHYNGTKGKEGQSLIEVLIATTIGVLLLLSAISMIAPSIQGNGRAAKTQVATSLAKEMMEGVKTIAHSNWHVIESLSTDREPSEQYYIDTTETPFRIATGTQDIVVSSTTYNRYFTVHAVTRDTAGRIQEGSGVDDPSTRKITGYYTIAPGQAKIIEMYVTRHALRQFIQSDWSAGPGIYGPATTTGNGFASSTNINYSSTTGSLGITGF